MDRRLAVVVFLVAFALCAVLTKPRVLSWNDGARIATVDALTACHTWRIDGSPFATGLGDEIRFAGHTYSDKPPLLAVLGAGVATVLAPLGVSLRKTPGTAIYLITLFTVGVSFAFGSVYAYAFQRLLGFEPRRAAAVSALTGVGTLVLPYAIVFTNHVPCGASTLAGCYHLVRARDGSRLHTALGGAFLSLAFAFDATAVLFAVAAAILLWGMPARRWALCAVAALPVVGLQLAHNVAISGNIIPPALNASVWSDPTLPLNAASTHMFRPHSAGDYLGFAVNLLVGGKGLFSFTPLMLIVAYGLWLMWRADAAKARVARAAAASAVAFFVMILLLQNDYDAKNFGERRYVDLFFLLCVALGPALVALHGMAVRASARLVIVVSIVVAALGTVAPFAGTSGQSGFAFGIAEYVALVHRAPIQGALDIVLLIAVVALVLRLVPVTSTSAVLP